MPFSVIPTSIPEVLELQPRVFGDDRGHFFESFNARDFAACTQRDFHFVQDNHSASKLGVLRGLHYQIQHSQGKLVRVIAGSVFDVAVDLRRSSPTFGRWVGATLSSENKKQLWIPPGFAHGFLTLTAQAEFLYKTTDYWFPEHERTLLWSDPAIAIAWPSVVDIQLTAKDASGRTLDHAETYP